MKRTFRRMFALLLCLALLTCSVGVADETENGNGEAESTVTQAQVDSLPAKGAGDESASGTDADAGATGDSGAVTETSPSTDGDAREGGVTDGNAESESENNSEAVETAPDMSKPGEDLEGVDPVNSTETEPEGTGDVVVAENSEGATAPTAGDEKTDQSSQPDAAGMNVAVEEQEMGTVASDEVALAAYDISPEDCSHPRDAWRRVNDGSSMTVCESATPYNERGHMASGTVYNDFICGNCGAALGSRPNGSYGPRFESHSFQGGVCTACGFSISCEHPADQLTEVMGYDQKTSFQDNGDAGHTATGKHYAVMQCGVCGETLPEVCTGEVDMSGPHEYSKDGTCYVCGHQNLCQHPEDAREYNGWMATTKVLSSNADEHTILQERVRTFVCGICGEYTTAEPEIIGPTTEPHDFGVDVCQVCHYENPCKHPAESVEIVKDDDSLIDGMTEAVDGLTHLSVYYPRVHKRCKLCGYEWDYETDFTAEPTKVAEKHRWSDRGVCNVCNYANKCTHPEDQWELRYIDQERETVEQLNARGHMTSWRNYGYFTCAACGLDLGKKPLELEAPKFEAHEFKNGACRYCGYKNECEHPAEKVQTSEWDRVLSVLSRDENGHIATGERHVSKYCEACREWLTEDSVEGTTDMSGPHKFSDGKCTVCGYANTCAHPEASRQNVDAYESREEIVESNESGHSVMMCEVTDFTCGVCGEYVSLRGEPYGPVEQPHEFGLTECEICGYANPCKHPAESVEIVKDSDQLIDGMTEAVDGLNHLSVYYPRVHKRCKLCGYEWDYRTDYTVEPTKVAEKHSWSDDGNCQVCGYVNRCEHPEDKWELQYNTQEREAVKPLNERGHMTSWRNYGYFTCAACGLDLGKKPLELEAPQFEGHEFKDGVCQYCEYVNECEHPAEKLQTNEWDGIAEVLSKDENGHVATGYHYLEKYCGKCGEYLASGPTTEEPVDISGPHRFYDGRCDVCGYENTCAHPEASRQDVYTYESTGEVVSSDENGHTVMVCEVTSFTCGVCGEYVSLRGEPYGPVEQPHEFGLTECEICGYANPCKHPEESVEIVERYSSRVDGMTEAIDGLTHMAVYYLETHKHCKLCGYEWDYETHYEEGPVRKPEHHAWSEDGTCSVCGYVNRCEHDFKLVEVYPNTRSVVSSNAYGHVTIEETMRTYRCAVCGYRIEENGGESYRVASGHDFDPYGKYSSTCVVCGYKCAHPAKYCEIHDHYTDAQSVEVIAQSAEEHTVKVKYKTHIREGQCLLCGGWLHEEEKLAEPAEITETYVHDWWYDDPRDGAYCAGCGMKHPGKHEGEPHRWIQDEDTGEAFCLYCGEVNTCPHDETVITEENWYNSVIDATRITDSTHSYHVWMMKEKYCAKCGMELGYEVMETPRQRTERHYFQRVGDVMICSSCRYVKPVSQPSDDSAPVVVDNPKFTDVPADEAVHGVAAADELRMGTALVKAMEGIEADYGPDTEITVQNADKLLTAQEHQSLQALEPVERVLVMLTVLGYEEEAQNALNELGMTLSDGAQALIEAVFSRTEAMTDEEFAAFRALIAEFFPESAQGRSGLQEITLVIRTGDGKRWECYGFTRTDEGWVFTKLSTMTA